VEERYYKFIINNFIEVLFLLGIIIVLLTAPFAIKEKPKKVINKTKELSTKTACNNKCIILVHNSEKSAEITIKVKQKH
jgi:hypothetical protein